MLVQIASITLILFRNLAISSRKKKKDREKLSFCHANTTPLRSIQNLANACSLEMCGARRQRNVLWQTSKGFFLSSPLLFESLVAFVSLDSRFAKKLALTHCAQANPSAGSRTVSWPGWWWSLLVHSFSTKKGIWNWLETCLQRLEI